MSMKQAAVLTILLGMLMGFTMVGMYHSREIGELQVDLIESTGFITVSDTITITVPEDLTVQQAEWIARMCDRIDKPVKVRSPYAMKFHQAERRMNEALKRGDE